MTLQLPLDLYEYETGVHRSMGLIRTSWLQRSRRQEIYGHVLGSTHRMTYCTMMSVTRSDIKLQQLIERLSTAEFIVTLVIGESFFLIMLVKLIFLSLFMTQNIRGVRGKQHVYKLMDEILKNTMYICFHGEANLTKGIRQHRSKQFEGTL